MSLIHTNQQLLSQDQGFYGFAKATINLYSDKIEIVHTKTNELMYSIPLSNLTGVRAVLGGGIKGNTTTLKLRINFNNPIFITLSPPLAVFMNNSKAKNLVNSIQKAKAQVALNPSSETQPQSPNKRPEYINPKSPTASINRRIFVIAIGIMFFL